MTPFSSPAAAGTAAAGTAADTAQAAQATEAAQAPVSVDWLHFDPASTTSVPLFDSAAIRRLEQAAYANLSPFTLMARAGAAAAAWLNAHAPAGPLLLLAGPGNNGGDALVAATGLHRTGREVQAWLLTDPTRLPADAARAWQEANDAGVPLQVLVPDAASPQTAPPWPATAPRFAAVVDGLLGIGLNRSASGALAEWIARLCALADQGVPVFALDVPSGLSADTGAGAPAVRATRTLTFIAAKPGLLTLDGRDCAGELDIAPLGLDYPPQDTAAAWANTPARFAAALPGRRHATHKGSFGTLAVIGGSIGMVGAPLLGARAALHLGAGRVHIGFLADPAPPFDPVHPELMLHPVDRLQLAEMSALVAGPGMGTGDGARRWLEAALRAGTPTVLDADALNLLATDAALAAMAKAGAAPRVLTPHPLEAARLMGCTVAQIQHDRLGAARALAAQWQAVVVLKGSGTVIASPGKNAGEHAVAINPTGNAGLATAGTGDVLAGMIGALLAQGMAAEPAALAGVWLHGRAADRLVAGGEGPAGLTAGELPRAARYELNALNKAGARR